MLMTIHLTLGNNILLCLMILTATVFMPYRGLAKNFPKDVQAGSNLDITENSTSDKVFLC